MARVTVGLLYSQEWLERGRRVRRDVSGARAVISDYQLDELRDAVNQLEIDSAASAKKDEFDRQLQHIDEVPYPSPVGVL